MDLQNELTEKYRTYLQQLGYSKSSINMLPACVLDFLQYTNATEPKEISQEQIQSYYEYLQNRPHKRKPTALSESFINHNIYSLKVFFNWLEQTHQIKYNPISNLKFKRPRVNVREPLSKEEITQLFEATENSKEIAILHLFYSCGLRRTEAENLNTSDIHFTQNLLYVREGKGAKRRVIPITEKVKKELQHYLKNDKLLMVNCKCKEAYMLNERGTRMRGDQFNNALKKLLTINNLPLTISLHHLRHSIATHLLENGLSIEFVRDFLGHTHLEATQIYAKVNQRMMNLK
jgi:integrase/recombinase XerD